MTELLGHSFGVQMKELQKEVELQEWRKYTRNTKSQTVIVRLRAEQICDHVNTENHCHQL